MWSKRFSFYFIKHQLSDKVKDNTCCSLKMIVRNQLKFSSNLCQNTQNLYYIECGILPNVQWIRAMLADMQFKIILLKRYCRWVLFIAFYSFSEVRLISWRKPYTCIWVFIFFSWHELNTYTMCMFGKICFLEAQFVIWFLWVLYFFQCLHLSVKWLLNPKVELL